MSERLQPPSATPPTDEEVEAQQRAGARRTALLLLLIVLIIAGVAFYYLWNMRAAELGATTGTTTETNIAADTGALNVLMLGVAERESDETVEAIVVTSFRPRAEAVDAVALPVNTVLPWAEPAPASDASTDGERADTLQHVYAADDRAAFTEAVERLVGAPVHHTVRVDFEGFVELVDLLGGVPVDVASDIVYRSLDGEVLFQLEPGLHRLSGEEALLYVRYKGTQEEGRRIGRQWRFIEAMLTEVRTQMGWDKVRPLLGLAMDHVRTDLTLSGMTDLARWAFDAKDVGTNLHVLPGAADDDGWVVDVERAEGLSVEVFRTADADTDVH